MKKTLLTLSIAALLAPMVSAPTVSADDTIQTAKITDGVVNIDYPSKYAGRSVTIEDGHYQYANLTLDANGDASKDLKTGSSFRTEAPDYVYLNFEGFANPIQRGTSLVKELSGYRLMFKQNFNATEEFSLKIPLLQYYEGYAEATLTQADTIKRYGSRATLVSSDSTGYTLNFDFAATTQATYSGTSRPTTAVVSKNTLVGGAGSYPQDAQFVFDGKSYPGVVLR